MVATESFYLKINGVNLHIVQKGPRNGKLVLLLHGFPEFWYGWHKQMDELAELGYQVWAPDQRGYNLSGKPENVQDYHIDKLADDAAGLIKASGKEKAILVGHDWGGIVSWRAARRYPELLDRVIVLNAPHEAAVKSELKNPFQLFRSSYAVFFQLRGLPEKILSQENWKPLTEMMKISSQNGTFSEEDFKNYRKAWSEPRALKSMINWYRANAGSVSKAGVSDRVKVPAMLIWGEKDQFLGQELAHKSIEMCDRGRVVFFEKATHWIHLEEAGHMVELLHRFAEDERFLENKMVSLP